MNVYINTNVSFKNVPKELKESYTKDLNEFILAMRDVDGSIPKELIDRFRIKKMKTTKNIFKFYLNNTSGVRCLFKYDYIEDNIFNNKTGLFILRIVNHDDQGIVGRALDKKSIKLKEFLLGNDNEIDPLDKNDKVDRNLDIEISNNIRAQSFKLIPVNTHKVEKLLKNMYEIDDSSIYRLSEDQELALMEDGQPLFIRGSAGSGKTLLAITKALENSHKDIKQAYFTYTPLLRDNAENLFNKYSSIKGVKDNIDFYEMNEYFLNILKKKRLQLFTFPRFEKWMDDEKLKTRFKYLKDLSTIEIWTEIRGLIKGYIGNDYYRIRTISNIKENMSKERIKKLEQNQIIKRVKRSSNTYFINDSQALYQQINTHKYHKILLENDTNNALIDEYSYVEKITEGYSLFDKQTRKQLLDFVKNHYQKYLEKNNYLDDNDLARLLIKRLRDNNIEKFDYIIIDEVQDLTEMQIIALTKLSNNINNIFMTGDNSQVINPTLFKKGRTGLIFRNIHNVVKLNTEFKLNKNYRNSPEIVQLIKNLLSIRQAKLGKYSEDIEEKAHDTDRESGLPFLIKMANEDFVNAIRQWIDVPRVAIIVSDDNKKEKLKNIFNIDTHTETNIFSVHEVKGQEFSKILTLNIISDHKAAWADIMSGTIKKNNELVSKYKYYFNLLYVAITRGRNNVYMYESVDNLEIIKAIKDNFEEINQNNIEALDVRDLDTKDNMIDQAKRFFYEGEYQRAKNLYIKLNDSKNINLSEYYHLLKVNNNVDKALIGLLSYNDNHIKEGYKYIDKDLHPLIYLIYQNKLKQLNFNKAYLISKDINLVKTAIKYKDNVDNYNRLLYETLKLVKVINDNKFNKIMGEIKNG